MPTKISFMSGNFYIYESEKYHSRLSDPEKAAFLDIFLLMSI